MQVKSCSIPHRPKGRCFLEVLDEVTEDEKDLMQDFVSLVTSFCARLYGKRRTKRKTERIIQELKNND